VHSRKAIGIVTLLIAILAAGCFFDVYSITRYTCLECRATLTKRRILGIPIQNITQDSYSDSILAQNPSHEHQWRWCGSEHSHSLATVTFSCGRQHPIWQLPVPIQARYSQLVSAAELHAALRAIDSPDRKAAEAEVNRVYEQVLDSR